MFETKVFEEYDVEEIEAGKIWAALAYIGAFCCCLNLVSIVMAFVKRDNDYHLFHARQGLGLFIVAFAVGIPFGILYVALSFLGTIGSLIGLGLYLVFALVMLVFVGFGAYSAFIKPEYRALPLLGEKFEEMLKNTLNKKEA